MKEFTLCGLDSYVQHARRFVVVTRSTFVRQQALTPVFSDKQAAEAFGEYYEQYIDTEILPSEDLELAEDIEKFIAEWYRTNMDAYDEAGRKYPTPAEFAALFHEAKKEEGSDATTV